MQPPTAAPRTALTEAAVVGLLRDAPAREFSAGLELLNPDLTVAEDLSTDLAEGSVSRSSYATLHGTCTFKLARDLDWGRAIVRPYATITDDTTTARFNLGAYYTSTPSKTLGVDPLVFDVTGYDIVSNLDDPIGATYGIAAGENYLATVEDILIARGVAAYYIDQSATAKVLPTPRVWALPDQPTWLNVVNDLLSAVGYAGIYSDWDGRLRATAYSPPRARPAEWTYDVNPATTMLGPVRELIRDYFETPNSWTFWLNNVADGPAPVDGNGIYTYTNEIVGSTSVAARGRVITRAEGVEAADHAALVDKATQLIDADMTVASRLPLRAACNPLHWHFDRVDVDDPGFGPVMAALVTSWTLPLDGTDMTLEITVLDP